MYFIVEFYGEEDNPVEVISHAWFDQSNFIASWPGKANKFLYRVLLNEHEIPDTDWTLHPVKVLYHSDDLTKAEKWCSHYLNGSNVKISESKLELPARIVKLESLSSVKSIVAKHLKTNTPFIKKWTSQPNIAHFAPYKIPQCAAVRTSPLASNSQAFPITTCTSSSVVSPPSVSDKENTDDSVISSTSVEGSVVTIEVLKTSDTFNDSSPIEMPFEEKVLTYLETVIREQHQIKQKLDDLEAKLSSFKVESSTSDFFPHIVLPLTSVAAFGELEEQLNDPSIFNFVLKKFSSIGGRHLSECTSRILSNLIAHEIVFKFSRTGKGKSVDGCKKISFDSFANLKKIVLESIRCNLPHCTEQQVDFTLGNWFKNWKDRQGGRRQRRKASENPWSQISTLINTESREPQLNE